MTLLMRWLHHGNHPYIFKINLNPKDVLLAFARQTSAALPLSYFLVDPSGVFAEVRNRASFAAWICRPDAAAIAFGALALCYLALGWRRVAASDPSARRWVLLIQLGLLLALLPAVPIAVSAHYQAEIAFGKGYLPVYIQYYGVSLLLASGLWLALSRWSAGGRLPRWGRVVVAILVAATTGVTYCANGTTVTSLGSPPGTRHFNNEASWHGGMWQRQRLNLETALHAGLMADVPEHAAVLLANGYPWWHEYPGCLWFYAMHTTKVLAAFPESDWSPNSRSFADRKAYMDTHPIAPGPPYRLRDICMGRNAGCVVLTRLDPGAGGGPSIGGREFRVFVRHPHLFRAGSIPAFLLAEGMLPPPAAGGERYLRPDRDLRLLRSGSDWGLFAIRLDADQVDANRLRPVFNPAMIARMVGRSDPGPLGDRGAPSRRVQ